MMDREERDGLLLLLVIGALLGLLLWPGCVKQKPAPLCDPKPAVTCPDPSANKDFTQIIWDNHLLMD